MKKLKAFIFFMLCMVVGNSLASTEQERIYLVQLINQIDAMTPLVLAAEKEQPNNTRVQFHYAAWHDDKGHTHNGLLEDIKAIKQGILEKLNNAGDEPRAVNSIKEDYLDKTP